MQSIIGLRITRESPVIRSCRVVQTEGLFDIPANNKIRHEWTVDMPLADKPWNVGLILGPSGCGKSTILREAFKTDGMIRFDWPHNVSVVDGFPSSMGIREITELLSSVGFSSPPSWLKPFDVLSNGEKFRVTMARLMAESTEVMIVDEFTSVIDRTVAQIGSHAIAKSVRKRNRQLIVASCHEDILEWLQPDWVFRPDHKSFQWRLLQRRPDFDLDIAYADRTLWKSFAPHHYLSAELNKASTCFVGINRGRPVVFAALLPFPHAVAPGWRCHRIVTLPDYQGVGIGMVFLNLMGQLVRARSSRFRIRTSHPSFVNSLRRHREWRTISNFGISPAIGKTTTGFKTTFRFAASFEYVGARLNADVAARLWPTTR